MSRPRKLDDAEIGAIRAWAEQWRALPTRNQIAKQFGISTSMLDKIIAGYEYKVRITKAELDGYANELLRQSNSFTSNDNKVGITESACTTARS